MSRLHRDEPPDAGVNAARSRRALARPTFPRQRTIKFVTFRRGFTLLRIGGITPTLQARQTAGARHERTLFAVACKRLFGQDFASTAWLPLQLLLQRGE